MDRSENINMFASGGADGAAWLYRWRNQISTTALFFYQTETITTLDVAWLHDYMTRKHARAQNAHKRLRRFSNEKH
jgi:hypothetical protein